jgi:hypothetical protein
VLVATLVGVSRYRTDYGDIDVLGDFAQAVASWQSATSNWLDWLVLRVKCWCELTTAKVREDKIADELVIETRPFLMDIQKQESQMLNLVSRYDSDVPLPAQRVILDKPNRVSVQVVSRATTTNSSCKTAQRSGRAKLACSRHASNYSEQAVVVQVIPARHQMLTASYAMTIAQTVQAYRVLLFR